MALSEGLEAVRNAIRSEFHTEMGTAQAGVLRVYSNQAQGTTRPGADDEWVRLSFPGTTGIGIEGIGERGSHARGVVVVDCFTEIGGGTKRASEILDSAIEILQGVSLGGAWLGAASHQSHGVDGDGRFWHESLTVPYRYEPTPS